MSRGKITIQTIANEAGVSTTTVSRVLNGKGKIHRINPATQERVLSVAKRLNYKANNMAKSLRLNKSFTLGLVVPDISNPWFAELAKEIEKASREKNYHFSLCNSDDSLVIEKQSLELLKDWNVDGIIIAPIGVENDHILEMKNNGMPIVLVDRFFDAVKLPYVSTNDFDGAYQAVKYLIELGHTSIVCVQGLEGTSTNTERVRGYKAAISEYELILGFDFGFDNGYQQGKKLVDIIRKNEITAIFSAGSQITLGLMKAFKEEGIIIPTDVSLVSFDETAYSDIVSPPLTTVAHFDNNIGAKAVEMLFKLIDNQEIEQSEVLFPTKLIKRASAIELV